MSQLQLQSIQQANLRKLKLDISNRSQKVSDYIWSQKQTALYGANAIVVNPPETYANLIQDEVQAQNYDEDNERNLLDIKLTKISNKVTAKVISDTLNNNEVRLLNAYFPDFLRQMTTKFGKQPTNQAVIIDFIQNYLAIIVKQTNSNVEPIVNATPVDPILQPLTNIVKPNKAELKTGIENIVKQYPEIRGHFPKQYRKRNLNSLSTNDLVEIYNVLNKINRVAYDAIVQQHQDAQQAIRQTQIEKELLGDARRADEIDHFDSITGNIQFRRKWISDQLTPEIFDKLLIEYPHFDINSATKGMCRNALRVIQAHHKLINGDGLKRRTIKGRGLNNDNDNDDNDTLGHDDNNDKTTLVKVPESKYKVDMTALNKNSLCVKYVSTGNVKMKPIDINDNVKHIVLDILTNKFNIKMYNMLSESDKKILIHFVDKMKLNDKVPIENTELTKMYYDFTILRGEYLAGNDNDIVKKQLRKLTLQLMQFQRISATNGKELLYELSL